MSSSSSSKPGASDSGVSPRESPIRLAWRLILALLAVLYFNTLFSYQNVPSTLGIDLVPRVSVELVVALCVMGIYRWYGLHLSRGLKAVLAIAISVAALVRYVDVTSPGVLGRDFNVHADLPHVHRVAGMFWDALPLSSALGIAALLILLGVLATGLNALGLVALEGALSHRTGRQVCLALCTLALPLWLGGELGELVAVRSRFAHPTTAILGKQVGYLLEARELEGGAFPSTSWSREDYAVDLEGLAGAHVFLIFLESYGATLIDDEHHYSAIAPRFARFEKRLSENGFASSSAKIVSPTFAGGSWRAHATLLSGIRLGNEHFYNTLLESNRKTLVHLLSAAGYRTITAEPAIVREWPDGAFFEFDKIYDFEALEYRGPDIGWWKIPDQYTLYKIYRDEILTAKQPLFAKIALIMTHIPYFPVPPYVPDWSRFADGTAYSQGMASIAADDYRDLRELSSRYVKAFHYELDILEDFIVDLVPPNSLVIVCGDHQPPKLATHTNDSWAVPIQLLSRRRELIEPFYQYGFRDGLVPHHPAELAMEDFLPAFLDAFAQPQGRETEAR